MLGRDRNATLLYEHKGAKHLNSIKVSVTKILNVRLDYVMAPRQIPKHISWLFFQTEFDLGLYEVDWKHCKEPNAIYVLQSPCAS